MVDGGEAPYEWKTLINGTNNHSTKQVCLNDRWFVWYQHGGFEYDCSIDGWFECYHQIRTSNKTVCFTSNSQMRRFIQKIEAKSTRCHRGVCLVWNIVLTLSWILHLPIVSNSSFNCSYFTLWDKFPTNKLIIFL